MRTCHAKLRCFDWDGELHLAKAKRGAQHGDPLEMLIFNLIFNLTTLHLGGRTLAKYPQARASAYADDGCIKGKMRIGLEVLADLKCVLTEDGGVEVKVCKTWMLGKGMRQQAACHVAQEMIKNKRTLATLSRNLALASFSLFLSVSIHYVSMYIRM
jgi:hypothetical protein